MDTQIPTAAEMVAAEVKADGAREGGGEGSLTFDLGANS